MNDPNAGYPQQAPVGPNARDTLNVPSILLIISGAIGVLNGLSGLVMRNTSSFDQLMGGNGNPDVARQMEQLKPMLEGMQKAGPFTSLIGIACSALIIYGALQMRALKAYNLALAAAIVAVIPCLDGCCCISLPVGIWALVLLMRAEVKAQFT